MFDKRSRHLALVFVAASLVAQAAAAQTAGPMESGASQLHEKMMKGMQTMQAIKPTGDTDKDFAMMMRAHHEQAVTMAKTEAEQGKSPEMKSFAAKVIKAQQKEIEELDRWIAQHR